MKKILLAALALAAFTGVKAQDPANAVYMPEFKGETVLGDVVGISADGKYAVIFDDENTISYLWRKDSPYTLTQITAPTLDIKVKVYDVNNNGTMVGAFVKPGSNGKETPMICKDGEWKELPYPVGDALNTNYPRFISEDEKYIGGIMMCNSRVLEDVAGEKAGGYRAVKWTRGDDGEYTCKVYVDMPEELSSNQGFTTLNVMTEDGSVLAGATMVGFSGMTLPTLIQNDNFRWVGDVKTRMIRTLFYAPTNEWDDRVYFFVDDYCNLSSTEGLSGAYFGYDNGKLYGRRTIVNSTKDIDYDAIKEIDGVNFKVDDLNGGKSLANVGLIYDLSTGELEMDGAHDTYVMACNGDIFLTGTTILTDGEEMNLGESYGVSLSNKNMIFNMRNDDATVIGGSYPVMNPANGEYQYFPVLVAPYVNGIDSVTAAPKVTISVAGGFVTASEGEVELYTLDGQLSGKGAKVAANPGLYIAKAGNVVKKVFVK